MNTIPAVTSIVRSLGRVAALSVCFALAACNDNSTWKNNQAYVRIGGFASGVGSGPVVIANSDGDSVTLTRDGQWFFSLAIPIHGSYQATVQSVPNGLSCTLQNDTGFALGPDVTSIQVNCTTLTYTIAGQFTATPAGPVTLQNNGETLTVNAPGPFQFSNNVTYGGSYGVSVLTPPSGELCTVSNGSGTNLTHKVSNVTVACATPGFNIIANVMGLAANGIVTLQDNGTDTLSVSANGNATFATQVTGGNGYAVTVATWPIGQKCAVTGPGSGVVNGADVTVAVTCTTDPNLRTPRPLPAIYLTGKAIGYSPYRAAGPCCETVSAADIDQDLALLELAGFNLLRLFGADPNTQLILDRAALNHPGTKFQLGLYLNGPTVAPACLEPINKSQIATAVALANAHSGPAGNVVTVSVGNETSLANNQGQTPTNAAFCLATYVSTVRNQVTQPVTADDDWTFYAGRQREKPDTVLPLLDFASIHVYPFLNADGWFWKATTSPATLMNAALGWAKARFADVAAYTHAIAPSMPITIGESGWKWRPTNPTGSTNPATMTIEDAFNPLIANPVNAKWYYDLMFGNPLNQPPNLPIAAWVGSAGGPVTIFYFNSFDETWKGVDDGWGLWDKNRVATYGLCDTPAASAACNATSLYNGAGYFH